MFFVRDIEPYRLTWSDPQCLQTWYTGGHTWKIADMNHLIYPFITLKNKHAFKSVL